MNRSSTWLLDCAANIYSQSGEDGIIAKILEIIPGKDKWCVEFGAWDGRFLSNTRNLILSLDYSAVLIEANRKKYTELRKTYASNKQVITLNRFVGFSETDNLDKILYETPIPHDFDFLSIDIDGNDYHVWKYCCDYKPKVVCIEFNPTIPNEVEFVQSANGKINQGSSLSALVKLGKAKGYELISVIKFNAFFVRSEYYPLFNIDDNCPEGLRTDRSAITYLFSGYDGKIFLEGAKCLPWHGVSIKQKRLQQVSKIFRRYPGTFGLLRKCLFYLYKTVKGEARQPVSSYLRKFFNA